MTAIEIILLIIGMLFILASFWVTEKLSPDELEHISELSKEEMGIILEHELANSKKRVEAIVDETIDASKERTERSLEKQTNEKIMAINEFSDTVIEKMNKTHNEIMFLYSMLNDKHTELTGFSSDITEQIQRLKVQEEELTNYYLEQLKQQGIKEVGQQAVAVPEEGNNPVVVDLQKVKNTKNAKNAKNERTLPQAEATSGPEETDRNVREEIFALYQEGRDSVTIAKKLGMGVGEVRLILGLYKGEYASEI